MKRILYITRAKLSLSRAHSQNILKTAEAITHCGDFSMNVFSSAYEDKTVKDIFARKGVEQVFSLDVSSKRRLLLSRVILQKNNFDILYYRDPLLFPVAFIARRMGKKVIFEVHGSHEWKYGVWFWRIAVHGADGAIFITKKLQEFYRSKKPSVVVHSAGVDMELFDDQQNNAENIRKALGMPGDAIVAMYVGSFFWYSLDSIIEMLKDVSEQVVLVLVGAKEEEIIVAKKMAKTCGVEKRLFCVPRVMPVDVPHYLLSADILVNPVRIAYPGSISSKLYEYMAAARPIVSSRGGANDEILVDGQNALIVDPMGAQGFARAIMRIVDNPDLAKTLSQNAKQDSTKYTWLKRGEIISEFLKKIS